MNLYIERLKKKKTDIIVDTPQVTYLNFFFFIWLHDTNSFYV